MLAMAAGPGAITDASPVSGAGEEEGKYVKPFTPEKAKELIMSLQQPAVFCNMVFDWPAQHWTAKHLSEVLQGKQIRFRMGMKSTGTGRTASHCHHHVSSRIPTFSALVSLCLGNPLFLIFFVTLCR